MDNKPEKENIENTKTGRVQPRKIVTEMKESYIDYAMSVIVARAIPDVRDGLKPVHRRILYSMHGMGLTHSAKFRKSAAITGDCFVKNTLILTDKGLTPIQDIKIGDQVYTQNSLRKVIQLYEMPKKPLLKVNLANGLSNTVTLSQKFKVLTPDWKFAWKEAKDLTKNDFLTIKADYPEINNLIELNKIEKNQPLYLNKNIAYLLGFFVSDGWISEDYGRKKLPRIGFATCEDRKIIERLVSIFKQEFDYTPTIETKQYSYTNKQGKVIYNEQYRLRVNRKVINEFFVSNFDLKNKWALTKEIPSQIFNSPKDVIFSFISGLIEGDGHISLKRNVLHYGSISEKLINQLQLLLQSQGIFSSKYSTNKNLNKDRFILGRTIKKQHKFYSLEFYSNSAVKLASKLNLASEAKNQRACNLSLQRIINHRGTSWNEYDIIPYAGNMLFKELSENHLGAGWYQDMSGSKFRMGIKYPTGQKIRYSSDLLEKPLRTTQVIDWQIKDKLERIGSPLFQFLEEIIQNKIYFAKVASVKKSVAEKTYDFEVENDHEFVANGIISHNCLGKYHPHGDMAVYDSMARMAQDFSLRYPLVHGQGNFGSIDGDPPAAARYTEAKLSKLGEEMLKDISRDTVDFTDNYDGTRKEPIVLPSPVPQLLLNGSLGIAVGMATNIPPHNLSELVDALVSLIDNPKKTNEEIYEFIKGPDFPGGGAIYGKQDIIFAYTQGKGPIVVRGKAEIEENKKTEKTRIVISEIPFQVQKSSLIEHFAALVHEKRIQGIKDIRDESDKEGMRIVVDLQKGAYPQKILNRLYKFSDLQKTFHLNMLTLEEGIQPKVMSLVDILNFFIEHRRKVVHRRTRYNLEKAKNRAHILEGLSKCLSKIDEVIKIIRNSKNREEAQQNLIKRFKLTQIQADAILETKLAALAKLERKKIEEELKEILERIKTLTAIIKNPKKIDEVVKKELKEAKEAFGDARRTKVFANKVGEIAEEDLIPQEETIITLTQGGYIKRINPSIYKIQKRGGKGIMGMKTLQEDTVEHFLLAQTHDSVLFFTDSGKVFRTFAYEIPEGSRVARGRGISNFLEISSEDKILSLMPLDKKNNELDAKNLIMITENGIIKRTAIEEFENVRRSGLIAINLRKGDSLKKVAKSSGQDEVIITTRNGQSIRFKEEQIRRMGRATSGVKAITLKKGDKVVGMDIIENKILDIKNQKENQKEGQKLIKQYLLVVTENGYGKRTDLKEYRAQSRGGSGILTAKITSKTGNLKASRVLTGSEEDLIVISEKAQVIRTQISLIPKISRSTQGVRIMRLAPGDKVAMTAFI